MPIISVTYPSDGTTADTADYNVPIQTILATVNGLLDDDNIASLSGTKITAGTLPLSAFTTSALDGWIPSVLPAPTTVTYNGNRSYTLVFNSNDITDTVSLGMRLKATRTVSAPTQCTDLESGSSQYYSKTSPNKLSFTTTFTCSAWVKLESYTVGGIIARRNADTEGWSFGVDANGRLTLGAYRIASNNKVSTSVQSLPLGKWVHVAASMDVSVAGDASTLMYIDGVLVPSATVTTGTATALVQGTTALVVGAEKSAGTNPFDGKIAQAAVYSAVISAANIRATISQTLSGSETSLASAYSFNNSIADLNTTTPNDLTANGSAVATNADSPFGLDDNETPSGTTEFGIIMTKVFSTNTTLTVQVPEGCAIPTTGGVSALAYSTQKMPYGFPSRLDKWEVLCIAKTGLTSTTTTAGVFINPNSFSFIVPIGAWDLSLETSIMQSNSSAGIYTPYGGLSTSASAISDNELIIDAINRFSGTSTAQWPGKRNKRINLSSATTYYLIITIQVGGGTITAGFEPARQATVLKATCLYV